MKTGGDGGAVEESGDSGKVLPTVQLREGQEGGQRGGATLLGRSL